MPVDEEDTLEQPTLTTTRASAPAPPAPRRRSGWLLAILAAAVVLLIVVAGVLPRVRARSRLASETKQLAIPTVSVVKPKPVAPAQEIVLPANVQPYISAPIF